MKVNTMNKLKTSKVYLITNKINGKQYVGITVKTIEQRWYRHKYEAMNLKEGRVKQALHDAIRKYGAENFTQELIYESSDNDHIKEMEKHFIQFYQTHGAAGGYNMTLGGDGWHGMNHTEEAKKKMSEAHTGKVLSDEHKENISKAQKGVSSPKSNPEEWKKNLSESKRANTVKYHEYEITDPSGNVEITTNLSRYCEEREGLLQGPFAKQIRNNKPYKGYYGKLIKDYGIKQGKRSKKSDDTKNKIKQSNLKHTYKIIHPNGKVTITKDIKSFCDSHGFSTVSNLNAACRKNTKDNITDPKKMAHSKQYRPYRLD